MNIISRNSTVEEVFSNFLSDNGEIYQFSIPLYQREYSWGEKQWEDIFNDLIHSLNKNGMDTDYWGNIIVYKNDDKNEFEIVDGQQRLITLLLLILSVGDINKPQDYLPLKFNDLGNDLWQKIVSKEQLNNSEKHHAFNKCVEYFKKRIQEEKMDENRLFNHIQKTQLSIVTIDDELESNLLFGRLNTRGLPLSQVDLIKHKLFYETDRRLPPTGNDIVLEKWKDFSIMTRELKVSLDHFIESWWETHYKLDGESLYSSFQKELSSDDYLDFLDKLTESVSSILELKRNDTGTDNRIGRNLKWLLKISQSDKLWMVLIALEETVISSRDKIHFYEQLTVYEFCRSIMSENDFSELDNKYKIMAKNLLSEVDGNRMSEREVRTEFLIVKETMKELLPDSTDFIDRFSNLRFDDNGEWEGARREKMLSTYAIYTLNNWLETTNHAPGLDHRTTDSVDYSIEHIRAKRNAINSGGSEYLIGNLVVLEKAINNDLGDIEVAEKLSEYKKSSYPQMKEFLVKGRRKHSNFYRKSHLMEWDKNDFGIQDIENRGRYLADSFYSKIIEILEL